MIEQKLLSQSDLAIFGADEDVATQTKALLKQQKTVWQQLAEGYRSLQTIKIKKFQFDGFILKVQFNPGRITSSAASVDPDSIKKRKCFLCIENLPDEQKGILYKNEYLILCNPFPIFPEHFTISSVQHIPQKISGYFDILLDLSKDMGTYYTVFYNGPKCGASAPDHLHFQVGNKGFMLIEEQFDALKSSFGTTLYKNNEIFILAIDDSLRRFISVEAQNTDRIVSVFERFYDIFSAQTAGEEEPMLNIISTFYPDTKIWRVLFIPRRKHRPSFYYLEGNDKILLSPASVDFGGVLITPVEKDFNQLTGDHIIQMFNEVSLDKSLFQDISSQLKKSLETL